MTDIVERLRIVEITTRALYDEAADEIERLRAALDLAKRALKMRGPGYPLPDIIAALDTLECKKSFPAEIKS
jgi:hypothetical protein